MRVRVLFLGGTIAMTATSTTVPGGLEPALAGHELLGSLAVPEGVLLDPVDIARVDSSGLTFDTCLDALARADEAVRREQADAVVVVQGTDTLEETAYLWDLLWPHPHPFVVTGAMRAADAADADGAANLLAAVLVAASPDAAGQGVLVTLGDDVHAARHVSKRHSSSLSAFASPDLGPIGHLHEGSPAFLARVPRRDVLAPPVRRPGIGLLRASIDDDPALYRAAAQVSAGLVVEGLGGGQLSPQVAEVLLDLVDETPVVLVTRTGAGPVATRTYTGAGSGAELVAGGVVPGGRLTGPRARVLLRVLLGAETLPARRALVAAFRHHGA